MRGLCGTGRSGEARAHAAAHQATWRDGRANTNGRADYYAFRKPNYAFRDPDNAPHYHAEPSSNRYRISHRLRRAARPDRSRAAA